MNKRYVIYTAIIGKYDTIIQPNFIDSRFDYILFSNDIEADIVGVWTIKRIQYQNIDNTRVSRYLKTHSEQLLSDYDFSVWIDANIQIRSNYIYERSIELFECGVLIASMDHVTRNCIYDEAFSVVNMMVEHEAVMVDWCHVLRREKYPKDNGLFETNVLFRVSNNRISTFNNEWWNCIERFSRRDQLSFNFVLWKHKLNCSFFLPLGFNVRNSNEFTIVAHKKTTKNHCPIKKNEAWLMRYCWKIPEAIDQIKSIYFILYNFPFPRVFVFVMGQILRLKFIVEKMLRNK